MKQRWHLTVLLGLPLADLVWNLTHLNIGLVDFYGLAAFAHGWVENGAWPATPYFPAGYPILLTAGGLLGSTLVAGYLLSALGVALALCAVYLFCRMWSLPKGSATAAAALAWLAPVVRDTAGQPSVDALFTGVALIYMAALLRLWAGHRCQIRHAVLGMPDTRVLPWWTVPALICCAALLPLLRYHAVLVVLPVLLVLVAKCPGARRYGFAALAACAAALSFNYATYWFAFAEFPAPVTALQIQGGLQADGAGPYASSNELFADYANFADTARSVSLSQDPGLVAIAAHTAKSMVKYLRQPALLLSLLLALACLALPVRIHAGMLLALLWCFCYCLALSPAYYTARAASLPVMLCVALTVALAWPLARKWRPALLAAALLLLVGYGLASRSATAILKERLRYAQMSRVLDSHVQALGLSREQVQVDDWRLLPLTNNRWCNPYLGLDAGWLGDPEIRPEQAPGIKHSIAGASDAGSEYIVLYVRSKADSRLDAAELELLAAYSSGMRIYRAPSPQRDDQSRRRRLR